MIQYCFDRPAAVARMSGGGVTGAVSFFCRRGEVYVAADIRGLPREADPCRCRVFGFHIHEGRDCGGEGFADTGGHLDLAGCPHPCHTGDLPPLLAWDGRAFLIVRTGRFRLADVIGRTVVIHAMPDDFATQPSGHSGPVDKVGYFKIAAKKMTWKLRKEPLQEWGHLDMLDIRRCDSWKFERI